MDSTPDHSISVAGSRPPCPYCGFHLVRLFTQPPIMMDSEGNQCALVTDSFSPCLYIHDPHGPDWNRCIKKTDRDTQLVLLAIGADTVVHPQECREGVPLAKWHNAVMSR